MIYDFKGIKTKKFLLNNFLVFLSSVKDNCYWEYYGMKVEINPTIDFENNNILIRWYNVDEGFNDKIIYYNLADFKKEFTLINA